MVVRHKKIKHEGITYDCNQCDYKGAQPSTLKYHQQPNINVLNSLALILVSSLPLHVELKNIYILSMRVLAILAISVGIRLPPYMDLNIIYNLSMKVLVFLAINVNISQPVKEDLNII